MLGPNETTPPAASAPEPSGDEFDAALAELASEEGAPGNPPAAEPPAGVDLGPDDLPAPGEQPAAQPPAADGVAAETPAGQTPSDDLWAKASPELREARQKLERDAELRIKSAEGRQSALHRELTRAQERLAELERSGTRPATEPQPGDKASESDARFTALRDEYPEIAGPLLDVIGDLRKQVETLSTGVGQVQQERSQAQLDRQEQILNEKHPDWMDALGDDRFQGWLSEQPRPVKDAYQRNLTGIADGSEAAWLVDQWKRSGIYEAKASPAPTPTPTPPPPRDERRQRQLANGRDWTASAPPAVSELPDDFEGALDALAAQEEARQRRANA